MSLGSGLSHESRVVITSEAGVKHRANWTVPLLPLRVLSRRLSGAHRRDSSGVASCTLNVGPILSCRETRLVRHGEP